MPLASGTRLGPYEVVTQLGAGGMGEVYRAKDTRLDRTVAVKVLPEHIAGREEARGRFEREARSVASLNHAHICTLYDIGPNYMVMELVDGETLAARLEHGPVPLEQAIDFAKQIADALDRAHRAGVTHRDVKPANIMLTRDGVKVLDFGLAKSADVAAAAAGGATMTKALTTEGFIVGTPQYMAPEQFEGREADARSDIWAFGAVVYEMVTGQKAFQGKNYTSMVAAILGAAPAPMSVTTFAPSWLERLVMRCLEKDPEDRWQSMRDIVLELRSPPATVAPAKATRRLWPLLAVALCVVAASATAVVMLRRESVPAPLPMEFEVRVPNGALNISLSPNGRMLAWRDDRNFLLWLRSLDSATARSVELMNPISLSWSPDSRFLAFQSQGTLKTLDVSTLVAQTIVRDSSVLSYGTGWTHDGHILMGSVRGPLTKVRFSGGQATPALPLDEKGGELAQRRPAVLPDGERVLYISVRTDRLATGLYLARLDGKETPKRVYANVEFAFMSPDRLLVHDGERLMILPFDPKTGRTGEPSTLSTTRVTWFTASSDGRVIAVAGGPRRTEELVLYDRSGKKLETIPNAAPADTAHVEFSPDGRRILFERSTNENMDLWTVDLSRKVVSRLTFHDGGDGPAVWSADGQKIYFRAVRPDIGEGIFELASNGIGAEKLLHTVMTHHLHASPDGKYLLFERTLAASALDQLDLRNGNKAGGYLPNPAQAPQFSPDSRFVAYESSETGQPEVYVQTFPAGGGKWQISATGGIEPRWRADGKELFYDAGNGTIIAASLDWRNGSPEVISTKELFRFTRGRNAGTAFAVSPDGKTFAIRQAPPSLSESSILVKLNWPLRGR